MENNETAAEADEAAANPAPSALCLLRGIVWNFLSILTVSAVGAGLLLYAASQTQNGTAVSASEKLLAAVLDDDRRNLSRLAKDYANWDDAIRHLLTKLDETWAEKNIGAYLSKTFDLAVAAVISGNDDTIIAAIDGKIARNLKSSDFGPGMADLLHRVRTYAGAEEPPPAFGFVRRGDNIEIAAVSLFVVEYPDKSPPLPDPYAVLVVTKSLGSNALKALSAHYDLPGLHLLKYSETPMPAAMAFSDPSGHDLGAMTWSPRLPGAHIIDTVLPQMIFGLIAAAALTSMFVARARKLASQIERDSKRVLRNNEKLAESERKRTRAMAIAHAGTWEWNVRDNRHSWSDEARRIFGFDCELPMASNVLLERIHPDDIGDFEKRTAAWADSPGNHEGEFRIVRRDGVVRCIRFVVETTQGEPGRTSYLRGLVQDVTEQRRMEEKLRAVQKAEMLGYLAGGVAHEINNLLQVILGNIEMSGMDFKKGRDPRKHLEIVHRACEFGGQLTRQLSTYAGGEFVSPTVVDLRFSGNEMVAALRQTAGDTVRLDADVPNDLWPIFVDQPQLQTALANLVANARDAMPDGGRIEIKAANVHLNEAFASRRRYDVAVGDYVAIAIRDAGTGMSPATVENAFVPFFTTKEVGKGAGLGLSMVFGFVQRHSGGYVEIESKPGGGTTVWLYFPRTGDGAQKAA